MGRFFLILLLIVVTANVCGQKGYSTQKDFTYYFERKIPDHQAVFSLDSTHSTPDFFKYHVQYALTVVTTDSMCHYRVAELQHDNNCDIRYRDFLIKDSIYLSCCGLRVECALNQVKKIYEYQPKPADNNSPWLYEVSVSAKGDSIVNVSMDLLSVQFCFDSISRQRLAGKLQQIDGYYLCDSIFQSLQRQLDAMDTTLVDRFPLYKFTLNDIDKQIATIDRQHYETLLAESGLDNLPYLRQRYQIVNRMQTLRQTIEQKVANMDDLFFNKACNFERDGNTSQAIFYFKRALEYNPSHCHAIDHLSTIYTQNNLFLDNFHLWQNICVRKENPPCKDMIVSKIYDSLYTKTSRFMEVKNYYDALKMLDTIDLFCSIIPHATCEKEFPAMRTQAQQGIYHSYHEVIEKALKYNKLDLSQTYLFGLNDLMQEHGNAWQNDANFVRLAEVLVNKRQQAAKVQAKKRHFEESLAELQKAQGFADSLHYIINRDFSSDYQNACTGIYQQKLQAIATLQKKGNSQQLKLLEKEKDDFYHTYQAYIILDRPLNNSDYAPVAEDDNLALDTTALRRRLELLSDNIHLSDVVPNNYSLLDSFILLDDLRKLLCEPYSPKLSYLVNTRLNPTLENALTRYEQFLWTNDFKSAQTFENHINDVYHRFIPYLSQTIKDKKQSLENIKQKRVNQYLNEQYSLAELKCRELTAAKNYLAAYHLMQERQQKLQQEGLDNENFERYLHRIADIAAYQDSLQQVQVWLNLKQWDKAFAAYTAAYNLFNQEGLQKFGVSNDSLYIYLLKHNKTEAMSQACTWLLQHNDRQQCMACYFAMKKKQLTTEKQQLLWASQWKTFSNDFNWLTDYPFTQDDRHLLEQLLPKKTYKTFLQQIR